MSTSKLHKLHAMDLQTYSEHQEAARYHYANAKHLSRSGEFHSAAFAHHKKEAYKHRNAAHDMVKSAKVSSSIPMPMKGYKGRDYN